MLIDAFLKRFLISHLILLSHTKLLLKFYYFRFLFELFQNYYNFPNKTFNLLPILFFLYFPNKHLLSLAHIQENIIN